MRGVTWWRSSILASRNTTPARPHADSRILWVRRFREPYPTRLRGGENGHGTHVTGIVAGTGRPRCERCAGIAPGVSVLSLKEFSTRTAGFHRRHHRGDGLELRTTDSDTTSRLSTHVGGVPGSTSHAWTDPLALAARALVDRGHHCRSGRWEFREERGGRTAVGWDYRSGVAPWVLTACAFSTAGTLDKAETIRWQAAVLRPTGLRASRRNQTSVLPASGSFLWPRRQPFRGRRARFALVAADAEQFTRPAMRRIGLLGTSQATSVRDRGGGFDASGQPESDSKPDQGLFSNT